MIITKQDLVESGIASLTINANIMKDADGNHIADVMDEAFKTQAMSDDGFELVDGHRKTDTEFFVQNDGWFVRLEYAHTKDGKKAIQKADLMFSILEKDLLTQVKADPKFASGALYSFDVANFPDAVDAQADVQASPHEQTAAEKRAARKADKQKTPAPVEPAPLEIEEDAVSDEAAAPTEPVVEPVTPPVESPVVTPAQTAAAPTPTAG